MSMMQVGVAVRDITPDQPIWMDGYGFRDHPSEGIYAALSARALALVQEEAAALVVVADVLNFDREQELRIKASLADATGLPRNSVILCATHTHCGPRVADILMPGERNHSYIAWLESELLAAAREALTAAKPARVSFSRTRSHFGINRRLPDGEGGVRFFPNPEGIIDRDLDTYWFTTRGNKPLASLTVFGCHPTSRSDYLIGPDYPGYLRWAIERAWGGTALFTTGCAGNIRPAFLDTNRRFRSAEVPEIEAAGEAMAAEALAGYARVHLIRRPRMRTSAGTAMLPVGAPPERAALEEMALPHTDPAAPAWRREWARRLLARLETGPLPRAVPFTVQTLALDAQHALVFLAGEVVTEIGLAIKQAHPYRVISTAAYANGLAGYVPARSIYPQGGYEVNGAYPYYLQPAAFTADVEETILAEVARQLE